ncbi:PepSY domain-containing protein [Gelidibacter salicanalis]|uniref:PepSY domain-containing protein n=1 Tax=Gelidibacter salicanalis TaxID=291193 RepID=A0A934KN34_9FLAO|nr:PepSY domain-containing protein [Gelidibacter salicanalis]MBJ7880744.1 PepSY domain-containing protein [Gelidibacter salicanalis]
MVKRKTALKIRQAHRYLGLFLGLQFIMWTVSGLYFSWTDIDEIHGDQFLNEAMVKKSFSNLISPAELQSNEDITSLELLNVADKPYYWLNGSKLFDAQTGDSKNGITQDEALYIAKKNIRDDLKVASIDILTETGGQHEFRQRKDVGKLPAYVVSYSNDEALKAYISVNNGMFQTVRHRDWRIFDFLWMTHTMDYQGRDDFNNIVLRIFSILGLITVFSGFLLWYTSSPTVRKFTKKKVKK